MPPTGEPIFDGPMFDLYGWILDQGDFELVAKELDQTIIQLLGTGLKDEAIARRVGMSLRTTRRHIADIMKLLGAESRFQAGILAARTYKHLG